MIVGVLDDPPVAAPPSPTAPRARWVWPRWARVSAVAAIAALAGLAYGWQLGRDPLEPYYAEAVRSMAGSWHDFIYGAFDPAGTVTLDKLPGAFWVQALSVKAFGYSGWALIAPQAAEGVVTVLVLYRAVARLAGPLAGVGAPVVPAARPAVGGPERGNISDSLMILLVVLAADAVSAAITRESGTQWRLLLAAGCLGLAFQAKMLEAWLLLPALGLAYLVSGPGTVRRRVREAVIAGLVAGIVSVAWMVAISLAPVASRPYVDGSQHDSVFEQVFTYNGLGRLDDQTPYQALANDLTPQGYEPPIPYAPPGAARLLTGALGRDTGWLLPAAAVTAIWGLVGRRRRPRRDPVRACLILWGGWLATLWATFSTITTLHAYYTAALAPAAGAILGTGLAMAWTARVVPRPGPAFPEPNPAFPEPGPALPEPGPEPGPASGPATPARPRRRIGFPVGLAVVGAGTAGYAVWLVPGTGEHIPAWLVPAVIAGGLAGVILALAAARRGRPGNGRAVARQSARLFAAALGVALATGLLAPVAASIGLAAHHESAFDMPFEPAAAATANDAYPEWVATYGRAYLQRLQAAQQGAPYLMATQTADIAAAYSLDGQEVLPIGGFTGSIPSPTLAQLEADIRAGKFHLVIGLARTTDPRMEWIAAHCYNYPATSQTRRDYFCYPDDAGS
jgi:4-amino-4-deoxy-L-arabinose transferase-like glycosyltransferase